MIDKLLRRAVLSTGRFEEQTLQIVNVDPTLLIVHHHGRDYTNHTHQ